MKLDVTRPLKPIDSRQTALDSLEERSGLFQNIFVVHCHVLQVANAVNRQFGKYVKKYQTRIGDKKIYAR
eukprot:899542-Amphidinium_carterae.1